MAWVGIGFDSVQGASMAVSKLPAIAEPGVIHFPVDTRVLEGCSHKSC